MLAARHGPGCAALLGCLESMAGDYSAGNQAPRPFALLSCDPAVLLPRSPLLSCCTAVLLPDCPVALLSCCNTVLPSMAPSICRVTESLHCQCCIVVLHSSQILQNGGGGGHGLIPQMLFVLDLLPPPARQPGHRAALPPHIHPQQQYATDRMTAAWTAQHVRQHVRPEGTWAW